VYGLVLGRAYHSSYLIEAMLGAREHRLVIVSLNELPLSTAQVEIFWVHQPS
jgi:hypothetical protein